MGIRCMWRAIPVVLFLLRHPELEGNVIGVADVRPCIREIEEIYRVNVTIREQGR